MRIDSNAVLIGKNFKTEIECEDAKGIKLINCTFPRFYALNSSVEVWNCKGVNVGKNFVQLDKCNNSVIKWCEIINEAGKTDVEDNISLYESSGVVVAFNYIEGATPSPDFSGSGIMVDKGCSNCQILNNVVVNTQNAGIGISSGVNNTVANNRVISTGSGGGSGDVGIYIAKIETYKDLPFSNNSGYNNVVGWITAQKTRNDWWVPGASRWTNNQNMKTINRDNEHNLWLKLIRPSFIPKKK